MAAQHRETMKQVIGLTGYYADENGEIYSDRSGSLRRLSARLHKGYLHVQVRLGSGRKTQVKRPVHQIVLAAFTGPRPSMAHEGRHLDGNQMNNLPGNLDWGTRADNVGDAIKHGTHASLRTGRYALGFKHGRYCKGDGGLTL
jgi:hypothetical protein